MTDLKTLVDAESVRGLIRSDVTVDDLSDSVIRLNVYVKPAVTEVLRIIPNAADLDGEALDSIASALNKLVAAAVIMATPLLSNESFGDAGGNSYQKLDVASRAAELRREAISELTYAADVTMQDYSSTPAFLVVM